MKRIINISLWVIGIALVTVSLSFINGKKMSMDIGNPKIDKGDNFFLDRGDIVTKLSNANLIKPEMKYSDLDIARMEGLLEDIPEVEKADVFVSMDGGLEIKIVQKKPIVRIVNVKGHSVYLDDKGYIMPMSQKYTAKVPIFTGNIKESLSHQFDPNSKDIDSTIMDDIFVMAKYISKDKFWKSQIVQVYVNKKGEFELIPRVGRHRILFGESGDMEMKFDNLKLLYTQGFDEREWNNFDTINLKFKDQVVCSKR